MQRNITLRYKQKGDCWLCRPCGVKNSARCWHWLAVMIWLWCDDHARVSEPRGCSEVTKPLVVLATASFWFPTF